MIIYMAFHKIKLNSKLLIVLIGISSRLLSIDCFALGSDCGPDILIDGYSTELCGGVSTICDQHTAKCRCQPDYPIPYPEHESCLQYRKLGDLCQIDKQCSQTEFSVCHKSLSLPSDRKKFRDLFKGFYLTISVGEEEFGICQCKQGYIQAGDNCYQGFIDVNCSTSFDCIRDDLYSHCNKTTKQCICDTGHVYDPDVHQCKMIFKRFGQVCQFDKECQEWDPMLDCRYKSQIGHLVFGYCFCRKGFTFDSSVDRCEPSNIESQPNIHLCPNGFKYDEQSDECQPIHYFFSELYRLGANGPTKGRVLISNNKILETIVILFLCCIIIVFLGFWRYILPNTTPEPQNRQNRQNRVPVPAICRLNRFHNQTDGNNSLTEGQVMSRVFQLRLNLESPETQTQSNDLSIAVPLNVCSSNSELSNISQREDPPTYEEAIALFNTQK